ncbi:hypothetical protein AYI68_g7847 [Smittium mucronatum]|uniref:Uncharacterized protein n=1 Tax=Smittium mucronatum TaxID=133383 RepID=A0A1R0GMI7_9FUNG|nr:hypothetical protein AYI68_g7847 [Smittium mucronatum]
METSTRGSKLPNTEQKTLRSLTSFIMNSHKMWQRSFFCLLYSIDSWGSKLISVDVEMMESGSKSRETGSTEPIFAENSAEVSDFFFYGKFILKAVVSEKALVFTRNLRNWIFHELQRILLGNRNGIPLIPRDMDPIREENAYQC